LARQRHRSSNRKVPDPEPGRSEGGERLKFPALTLLRANTTKQQGPTTLSAPAATFNTHQKGTTMGTEYSKVIDHTMDEFEQYAATVVADTIQNAANGTERSAQASEFRLGMSNIGHCQQAAVYMIKQTPPSDERKKTAAFFGTVAGEALEKRMKIDHPGWLFQAEGIFPIPSGGELGSHVDIVVPAREGVDPDRFLSQKRFAKARAEDPQLQGPELPELSVQGIWDLKSKDKLDVIKKYGPSKQQVFQVTGYAKAMTETLLLIDRETGEPTTDPEHGDPVTDEYGTETGETVLDPTKPIWITDVYFDRSGAQDEAYSFGWFYDPAVLEEIDMWIHDVKYAVINNAEALKEKPREWCWSYCEYATLCRGNDTDAEGLIEDPETLAAVDLYAEGLALEKQGAKMKDNAKLSIPAQLSGTTGTHTVRWVEIGPTVVAAGTRKGYRKLDIRPIPGPKEVKPKAPRKKAAPKKAVAAEQLETVDA
jgi:hypothetical protein